jgi:hypothetical protein
MGIDSFVSLSLDNAHRA